MTARQCLALDGGWVVLYDRSKHGPKEMHKAWKAGDERFSPEATGRYVLLYRPDPDECRTWATPGRFFGTALLGEAKKLVVSISLGADPDGVLPVADGAVMGGLNQRQFIFCQQILSGKEPPEAYRLAGYRSKRPHEDGSKLLHNPQVTRYLQQQRGIAVKKFTMGREDVLAYLQEVAETPAGAVDKNHRLCQEYTDKPDEQKIKMPGKVDALKTINAMMGWDVKDVAADKQAEGIKAVAEVLRGMVAKRTGAGT